MQDDNVAAHTDLFFFGTIDNLIFKFFYGQITFLKDRIQINNKKPSLRLRGWCAIFLK